MHDKHCSKHSNTILTCCYSDLLNYSIFSFDCYINYIKDSMSTPSFREGSFSADPKNVQELTAYVFTLLALHIFEV